MSVSTAEPATAADPARTPRAPKAARSRLRPTDLLAVGAVGLRTRRMRTALTAVGIAIGIAALVAVMGISASSHAQLLAQLDALGTNRLQVRAGSSFTSGTATLGDDAVAMIGRIGPVTAASGVTQVSGSVRRTDLVPDTETGGINLLATDPALPEAVGASLADGRFLDAATAEQPAVVLGATAAQTLGIDDLDADPLVYVGNRWSSVVGILDPIPLYPNLDRAAFVGNGYAQAALDAGTAPSTVYVVTDPARIDAVRAVLPATANPDSPDSIEVSRPSDALAAKDAVDDTFTGLLLALGGVALLVGGIGIANVMVIAVLERRTEIGVRRALGATRRHIRAQFLTEAVLLSTLGGLIGVAIGAAITTGYALVRGTVVSLPPTAMIAGLCAAVVVGAVAGISPAGRAARLAPADAIRPA